MHTLLLCSFLLLVSPDWEQARRLRSQTLSDGPAMASQDAAIPLDQPHMDSSRLLLQAVHGKVWPAQAVVQQTRNDQYVTRRSQPRQFALHQLQTVGDRLATPGVPHNSLCRPFFDLHCSASVLHPSQRAQSADSAVGEIILC